MFRIPPGLDRFADRVPLLIVGLVIFMLLTGLLRGNPYLQDLMDYLGSLACIGTVPLAALAIFVWAFRRPVEEGVVVPRFIRPGVPGHRTWKHNVYDENAYAILGVSQDASRAQIREAFRALTQKHHPDAVPADEKERAALVFIALDHAYEILTDPEMRQRYDAWIERAGGEAPVLEHAIKALGSEDNRAMLDAELGFRMPRVQTMPPDRATESAPAGNAASATSAVPGPGTAEVVQFPQDPAPAEPTPDAQPPVVEIPESVREALGLPNATDPPSKSGDPDA